VQSIISHSRAILLILMDLLLAVKYQQLTSFLLWCDWYSLLLTPRNRSDFCWHHRKCNNKLHNEIVMFTEATVSN